MSNFPSRWFDFISHKELTRLRKEMSNTFELKIQIATSVIIAIVSLFLDDFVTSATLKVKIIVCSVLCFLVAFVFLFPMIWKFFKTPKKCNIFINGIDAITIFDEEIVYNVMAACEYCNARSSIAKSNLKDGIEKFHLIEIKYYIEKSIRSLLEFQSDSPRIYGNKKNQISYDRILNVLEIIDKIIENVDANFDENLKKEFYTMYNEMKKYK